MSESLFTREEIVAGLPARQARTIFFLIETRAGHLAARSRQAMERFLTEGAAEERELAFIEAFALGRDPPRRPTIQDLERYAPQWLPLVPEIPRLRAAIARLFGQKYTLIYRAVPNIRTALGLDEKPVQQAYNTLYREPLESIFALRARPIDRLRWIWAALAKRLESVPPFWTAFALTLTETVGAGILALPIALASVGPLAGIALLLLLGGVNVLTVACMAEAVTRSGTIRHGKTFVGRMVNDYLGQTGSVVFSVGVSALCFVVLLAFYAGFSTTMQDATGVPGAIWALLLFLIVLFFLQRKTLNATVASALIVGGINLGLLLLFSVLAFSHIGLENLLFVNVPFLAGRPFDPSILKLIFGVVLCAYFGHLSLTNCAGVVLKRDPSGRSLIRGTTFAMGVAIVIYCIWILGINGAIAPQRLASESGTALAVLAEKVGPVVHILGAVYVVLAVAMVSVHVSLALFNVVRERLPARPRPVVILPRRRGRLYFRRRRRSRGGPRLGLTYLGLAERLDGVLHPQFRLDIQIDGSIHHVETPVTDHWDETALLDRLPELHAQGVHLALDVLDATREAVRLRVTTRLTVTYDGAWDTVGRHLTDTLALPESLRQLLNWIMRQGEVSAAAIAAHLEQNREVVRPLLDELVEQGFVQEIDREGERLFRPQLSHRRQRRLPEDIWEALETNEEDSESKQQDADFRVSRSSAVSRLGERGRFFLSASPVIMVFLLAEWLLITGKESFPGPLSLVGVIVVSLLAGIFPVLLLVSSRRKGEFVPGTLYRWLGHPVVIVGIYSLFLASVFLHGLVIWQNPVPRAAALLIGISMLAMTVAMMRRGAFTPRVVVEMRQELDEAGTVRRTSFAVTNSGRPTEAEVLLGYPEGERRCQAASGEVPNPVSLRYAVFDVPRDQSRELKVAAHRITPQGDSEALPALLEISGDPKTARFDLGLSKGQVLLPLAGGKRCRLKIELPQV